MMSTRPENLTPQPTLIAPDRDELTRNIKTSEQSNNELDSRLHEAQKKNQELQKQISQQEHLYDVALNYIQGLEKCTDDQDQQIARLKQQLQQLESPKLLSYHQPQK
jgi:chromosome segregation ATPase